MSVGNFDNCSAKLHFAGTTLPLTYPYILQLVRTLQYHDVTKFEVVNFIAYKKEFYK
jgi:uncharacterized Fe-S cluster-containing radical SAM superfamily enzyme